MLEAALIVGGAVLLGSYLIAYNLNRLRQVIRGDKP